MTGYSGFNKFTPLTILLLLVVYGFVTHTYYFNLDLVVALRGFSVVDFTNSVLFTENFQNDYPGGAAFIGSSVLPWLYPKAVSWTGFSALSLMYLAILIEIILLIFSAHLISAALLNNPHKPTILLLSILFILSSARQVDLARFGTPFLIGQYYVVADTLRLAAIVIFLKKQYIKTTILLCICLTIHPTMTMLVTPLLFAILILDRREFRKFTLWISAIIFFTFTLFWYHYFIQPQNNSAATISPSDYFEFSRLFNSHWYLSDLNMILKNPERVLLPFMGMVLCGVAAISRTQFLQDSRRVQLFTMVCVIYVVGLVGLVACEFQWHVTILKITPQRISALAAFLILPIVVNLMLEDLRSKQLGYFLVGFALVASCFSNGSPYPIIITSVYALSFALPAFKKAKMEISEYFLLLFSIPILVLLLMHFHFEHALPIIKYSGQYWVVAIAAIGFALVLFQQFFPGTYWKHIPKNQTDLRYVCVLFLFLLACNWGLERFNLSNSYKEEAADYKETQIWAKTNTKTTDIFMVDPCISYGWRDFSQRSSWGTIQEFFKTSWLYSGNLRNFEEGIFRANFVGVDARKMLRDNPSSIKQNLKNVCDIARKIYYSKDPKWALKMQKEFGIDYFVFLKRYGGEAEADKISFQNNSFYVIKSENLISSHNYY